MYVYYVWMYVRTQRRIFLILSLQQTPAGFIAHDYWVYVHSFLHLHFCIPLSLSLASSCSFFFCLFIYFSLIFFSPGTIKTGNFTWQPVTFIIYLLFLFFILLLLLRFHAFAQPTGGIALLSTSNMNENQSISQCDMI